MLNHGMRGHIVEVCANITVGDDIQIAWRLVAFPALSS